MLMVKLHKQLGVYYVWNEPFIGRESMHYRMEKGYLHRDGKIHEATTRDGDMRGYIDNDDDLINPEIYPGYWKTEEEAQEAMDDYDNKHPETK